MKGANRINERTFSESINNAIKAMAATERFDMRGGGSLNPKKST
jgi:hypothetical protein